MRLQVAVPAETARFSLKESTSLLLDRLHNPKPRFPEEEYSSEFRLLNGYRLNAAYYRASLVIITLIFLPLCVALSTEHGVLYLLQALYSSAACLDLAFGNEEVFFFLILLIHHLNMPFYY